MFTTKERAIDRINAAERYRIKENRGTVAMKHIAFVGPPGSGKETICKLLLKLAPEVYEKALTVTNRQKRPGEEKGKTHIFTTEALFDATNLKVIDGTTYCIGKDEYGISLQELNRIIATGKKFVVFTSIDSAKLLKELFNGDVLIVYLDATREKRAINLHKKFTQLLVKGPEDQQAYYSKLIMDQLAFGDEEMKKYKAISEEEKKQDQKSFMFYHIEHGVNFNPYSAARFLIDNAVLSYHALEVL